MSPICVGFTVQRWFPVANMTRFMPVRVYDYYAPGKLFCHETSCCSDSNECYCFLDTERFNETMVNAYSLYVLSVCHVCGSYQCPYCPVFSGCPVGQPSLPVLLVCLLSFFALFIKNRNVVVI